MPTTEHTINDALAALLRRTRRAWRIALAHLLYDFQQLTLLLGSYRFGNIHSPTKSCRVIGSRNESYDPPDFRFISPLEVGYKDRLVSSRSTECIRRISTVFEEPRTGEASVLFFYVQEGFEVRHIV